MKQTILATVASLAVAKKYGIKEVDSHPPYHRTLHFPFGVKQTADLFLLPARHFVLLAHLPSSDVFLLVIAYVCHRAMWPQR